jgi:hypothetical protein
MLADRETCFRWRAKYLAPTGTKDNAAALASSGRNYGLCLTTTTRRIST